MAARPNRNGIGVVPQDYDYPGSVIEVDCGRETRSETPKTQDSKPITFAPVAPDTGASQTWGS